MFVIRFVVHFGLWYRLLHTQYPALNDDRYEGISFIELVFPVRLQLGEFARVTWIIKYYTITCARVDIKEIHIYLMT